MYRKELFAGRMIKKAAFSPARPARAKTRAFSAARPPRCENEARPACSQRFVAKLRRRVARRTRGAARDRGVLETVRWGTERRTRLSQQRIRNCSRSVGGQAGL